jgi:hypothetical protein
MIIGDYGIPATGSASGSGHVMAPDEASANATGAARPAMGKGSAAETPPPPAVGGDDDTRRVVAFARQNQEAAEIATGRFEDAPVNWERMNQSNATPAEKYEAGVRATDAQEAAMVATAANLTAQEALVERYELVVHIAGSKNNIGRAVNNLWAGRTGVEVPGFKQADRERNSRHAFEPFGYTFPTMHVAAAENLRDIATGTLPGRGELAIEADLKHAEAAEAKLLALKSSLKFRPDFVSRLEAVGEHRKSDPAEVAADTFQAVAQYRVDRSINLATWKAARDNAMKSGNLELELKTAAGLSRAEDQFIVDLSFEVETGTAKFGP